MQLKIKNKNNNTIYFIQYENLLTDTYNEEIDSMEVQIKHLPNKIDIEPLDQIIIYSDSSSFSNTIDYIGTKLYYARYFLVDKYTCTQITATSDTEYNYSISLFNEIKALEGIPLPSLSIKQLKTTNKRSVGYYLRQYLSEYGTKIRVKTGSTISWQPKYVFSQDLLERFDNVECPEMQWNAPTLRQVFNDLMMVDDCIPTINNGVIEFIDLSIEKDEMDLTGVNYIQTSQSSDDYVNELKIELKNVMQSTQRGVNDTNELCEYIGFRNDNASVISTENIQIETMNPILEVVSVTMCCPLTYYYLPASGIKDPVYMYKEIDITNMVYEKAEWQTLPTLFSISLLGMSIDQIGKYQNTSLYYDRQSNIISGFNNAVVNYLHLIKQEQPLIYYLNKPYADEYIDKAREIDERLVTKSASGWGLDEIKTIMFKVKYKTTASSAMLVSKTVEPTNKRAIVDNQTNSYVDSYAQGILEYMKANRLGNKLEIINARYLNSQLNKIATLGEKHANSIIFKREIKYYKDYAVVNYYATENYVLRDYFTGVKAKIRSWKIVDGSEALERHDIKKYILEFDYVTHTDADVPDFQDYFLSPLLYSKYRAIKLLNKNVVQFKTDDGILPSTNDYYQLDFVSRISGNSILFTFGMKDNYSVQRYIDTSITDDIGGLAQQYYKYVDDNGENNGVNIYLNAEITNSAIPADYTNITDSMTTIYQAQAIKPKVNVDQLGSNKVALSYDFHKDNSEITRITTQFEFATNSKDIVIGSTFLKYQQCIRNFELPSILLSNINIYLSATATNYKNVEYLPTDKEIVENKTLSVTNNVITIDFTANEFESNKGKYIYITSHLNGVMIAYQFKTQDAKLILNVLKDRNKNVYDSTGNVVESI